VTWLIVHLLPRDLERAAAVAHAWHGHRFELGFVADEEILQTGDGYFVPYQAFRLRQVSRHADAATPSS
jgi:hypothetical protein